MRLTTLVGLLFCSTLLQAQNDVVRDTLVAQDTASHVKRATLLSVCLPGAGQVYNHFHQPKGSKKAYWKVPLIYGTMGFTAYRFIVNQQLVNELKSEYRTREAGETGAEKFAQFDNQGILTLHGDFSQKRDFALLGFIALYGFQVLDACVEAHFLKFDISEDLSMQLQPRFLHNRYPGMGISLNFR